MLIPHALAGDLNIHIATPHALTLADRICAIGSPDCCGNTASADKQKGFVYPETCRIRVSIWRKSRARFWGR